MVSFWEQRSFQSYDVIVVGAGITGLSTAASLKELDPQLNILVLEKGALPTGASTKNAGFACFGSVTELLHDVQTLGRTGMKELVRMRWEGLKKTRSRLGDDRIDYQNHGGYELFFDDHEALNQIDSVNSDLEDLFDHPIYQLTNDRIQSFGFEKTRHLVFNNFEGQLDTGKLIRALWDYCQTLGILVITGTEVSNYAKNETGVQVSTASVDFQAKALAICTNAFTNSAFGQHLDISPGRGLVMAIKPTKPLPFRGTFHYDEGYYYFRNFNEFILFGGGRNLAREEETTTNFDINQKIIVKLKSDLEEIIIPNTDYEIIQVWAGIMAFGKTKAPILKQEDGIHFGVRLGGMGVAIGSQVGEELASQIIESHF